MAKPLLVQGNFIRSVLCEKYNLTLKSVLYALPRNMLQFITKACMDKLVWFKLHLLEMLDRWSPPLTTAMLPVMVVFHFVFYVSYIFVLISIFAIKFVTHLCFSNKCRLHFSYLEIIKGLELLNAFRTFIRL